MNRHVPAFQVEASVRCQVSGTEAEVKAKREKTVNTWLAAVIFGKPRGGRVSGYLKWEGEEQPIEPPCVVDGGGKREVEGTGRTIRKAMEHDASTFFLKGITPTRRREREAAGGRRGGGREGCVGWPSLLL